MPEDRRQANLPTKSISLRAKKVAIVRIHSAGRLEILESDSSTRK